MMVLSYESLRELSKHWVSVPLFTMTGLTSQVTPSRVALPKKVKNGIKSMIGHVPLDAAEDFWQMAGNVHI